MSQSKVIYTLTMLCAKKAMSRQYGKVKWEEFKRKSKRYFREISPHIPDIGKSIFSSSYEFAPCYIAWYKALKDMNFSDEEAGEVIWLLNDELISKLPECLREFVGKIYYTSFRNQASKHMLKQQKGELHPYDWTIEYRNISKQVFEIDIYSCGIKKLAMDYQAEGLLPAVCRMDYLFANRLKSGFERDKTLGDKNECCNCRYIIGGTCEWNPEKGFQHRK